MLILLTLRISARQFLFFSQSQDAFWYSCGVDVLMVRIASLITTSQEDV